MYRYKAINSDGEFIEGESHLASENLVVSELLKLDYVPIKIVEARRRRSLSLFPAREKPFDRVQFFENLSDYLDSGLSIDKALELEALSQSQSSQISFLAEILEGVRQGRPLSDGMTDFPNHFPSLYIGVIRAGEQTDTLKESLKLLATLASDLQVFRDKVRSALVYPAILTAVMLISILVLFGLVIPRFKSLFVGMGVEMSGLTAVIVGISDLLTHHWQVVLLGVLLIFFLSHYLVRSMASNRSLSRVLLNLPLVGGMVRQYNLYLFSVIMQILVTKKITIIKALDHVGEAINNLVYRAEVDLMKREISRGKSLQEVLNPTLFSQHYSYLVGVGEQTGQMSETFAKLSRYYYKQLDGRIKSLMTYIEPLIIMLLGLIVGLIVVSMLQAILGINELAV